MKALAKEVVVALGWGLGYCAGFLVWITFVTIQLMVCAEKRLRKELGL